MSNFEIMHLHQQKLLDLIEKNLLDGLSLWQIGALLGGQTAQNAKHHLGQLVKKGLVKFEGKNYRRIKAGRIDGSGLISIPVFGSANCGEATFFADDKIEGYIRISKSIIDLRENFSRLIALKARGNSMNRANIRGNSINDGDYVLVDTSDKTPEGYVVSVIDDVANIKKCNFLREYNQIHLISESVESIPPIILHEDEKYFICGKVRQVISMT